MDPFIGEIRLLPFNFAPRDWALCNGQLLAIQSNTALFSIIGTTYGGNGTSNFQLPNLQGRVVAGVGQGPGLRQWDWGEMYGDASVSLNIPSMPAHNHSITAMNNSGTAATPTTDAYLAKDVRGGGGAVNYMQSGGAPNTTMAAQVIGVVGGSQPHENRQPFLALNYCIALVGVYPQRN